MSPGHALSAMVRSWPNSVWALLIFKPLARPRMIESSIPRVNCPEQMRMKEMRSRWRGSILPWILNTKPEKARVFRRDRHTRGRWRAAAAAAHAGQTHPEEAARRNYSRRCQKRRASFFPRGWRFHQKPRRHPREFPILRARAHTPSGPCARPPADPEISAIETGARKAPPTVRSKRWTCPLIRS